jgi:hypothetical protein
MRQAIFVRCVSGEEGERDEQPEDEAERENSRPLARVSRWRQPS